jgi:hypothetical protein
MNSDALFLFLILLLGLVLCSFLGGYCGYEGFDIKVTKDASGGTVTVDGSNNIAQTISNIWRSTYDNYNHYSGASSSTQLQSGSVYTDGSGNNITVNLNVDGTVNLKFTQYNNVNPIVLVPQSGSPNVYVTSGSYSNVTATVITTSNGQIGIKVTMPNGQTRIFTSTTSTPITSTQYYGSTGSPVQSSSYSTAYYNGSNGGSAGAVTGPQGNTAYYAQGPQGNTVAGTTSSSSSNSDYYSSLPPGIPRSQIPAGQEDLYILKSQVVPPVCPVCPTITSSSNDPDKEEKCPPCPACARCPEPSFECKKVPNYSAIDNQYLPQPVLSDFSTFGM